MNVLRKLRKQMHVIANRRLQENVGGYAVYFVGQGRRNVDFQGWWRTKLDFYSMDVAGLSQKIRVNDGREFSRAENTVSLFAEQVPFEEHYETPCRFQDAWLIFRPLIADHPLKKMTERKGCCFFKDDFQLIRSRIHETALIASTDPSQRLLAQSAFLQILAHLCQASAKPGDIRLIGPLVKPQESISTFRSRILSIVGSELNISVDNLARHLCLSRSTLSHRFSTEMGETLVQLKNRLRLQRAQELIANPNKQLKEIAYESGFADPAYFTRLFTQRVGMSPSTYRKWIIRNRRQPLLIRNGQAPIQSQDVARTV